MWRMNSSRFVLVASCLFIIEISAARNNLLSGDKELQELLKGFNKPPVKSIQSPDGDIIDCIMINQQPAFDHPLLKDHVIQMRPSFEAEGHIKKSKNEVIQLWHTMNQTCPEGTVPIRRTKEEDLLRAHSLQHFGKKYINSTSDVNQNHEYAIIGEKKGQYYGAVATINVWQPFVEQDLEFSISQLWLSSGSFRQNDLNTIEAGWQVSPTIYGDSRSRFFIYWTGDAYQETGCYNLICPGFVQTSTKIAAGVVLTPVSVIGGPLYDIHLRVLKDEIEGKWWLKFGGEVVGYWPLELFKGLRTSAEMVEWGGEIVNVGEEGRHTGTDMGSGHFAEERVGKASYFMNIQVANAIGEFRRGKADGIRVTHPHCYNLKFGNSNAMGAHFFYGGPGSNPNC